MQGKRQEKEQERPEENGPVEEAEDPSLPENQALTEEAEPVEEDEEESEPVEEIEAEQLVEEELPQSRGCLRGCLMPIAAIVVICLAAAMILHAKWGNAVSVWLRQRIITYTQERVLRVLPEDMDEREIEASFEKVKTALKEGRIDEEILDEAIDEYLDVMRNRPPPIQEKEAILTLMRDLEAASQGATKDE